MVLLPTSLRGKAYEKSLASYWYDAVDCQFLPCLPGEVGGTVTMHVDRDGDDGGSAIVCYALRTDARDRSDGGGDEVGS